MIRVALFLALAAGVAGGEVTLIGKAKVAGTATDLSGLTDDIAPGVPHNRLGSFGSGIAYSGAGNRYICIDDRGPGDGMAQFWCRVQEFEIVVKLGETPAVIMTLVSTTKLTSAELPLVGASAVMESAGSMHRRFDPEGVRVGPDGQWYISEEYGPSVCEFGRDGALKHVFEVPDAFTARNPSAEEADELPPNVKAGRQPNRGFEGLTLTPAGKAWAILQSPLIQDGALDADGKRTGYNIRVLELDLGTGKALRQCLYQLETPANGVSEILAASEHQFLVLERDGKERKVRSIYVADAQNASDVSDIAALPAKNLAAELRPMRKTLLLDLMNPAYGLMEGMPEKIEGLTWGPDLADGRRCLLVTTDNDMKPDPTWVWVFAVDSKDLDPVTPPRALTTP